MGAETGKAKSAVSQALWIVFLTNPHPEFCKCGHGNCFLAGIQCYFGPILSLCAPTPLFWIGIAHYVPLHIVYV